MIKKKFLKKKILLNKDIKVQQFLLSENNRITYIYKVSKTKKVVEVTCVSLDIYLDKSWITIVYYDNYHGKMHRHVTVSTIDNSDTPTEISVRQRGTNRRLLGWAINDIKANYLIYKSKFLKRSKYKKSEILSNLF